ncbi:uncharacterized protein J4E79_001783 [Alternaria viburni]|uniref:uncharacterized protein n=1 Tax=Alternaria viburni TaxID=566460 RepID=UPI0020C2693A|nr:uncharacterized protein J4E79_001783 [Alternaria viburni]KAI4667099.1 hypothetical protein J4E79_001783 [Alternaria viburni]
MANTSFLLDLPAELRNTIYQLALTHSEPLHYRMPKDGEDKPYLYHREAPFQQGDDEKLVEYNQLKYVNKQLYAETAGLELKFNDVTLSESSGHESPSDMLTAWVSSISIAKRSWIKTISITCDKYDPKCFDSESAEAVARLARLCNDIPTMRVKCYNPFWAYTNRRHYDVVFFFMAALSIYYAYRGETTKYLIFDESEHTMLKESGKKWREPCKGPKVHLAQLQAENLRYFPTLPANFTVPVIKANHRVAEDGEVILEAEQWIGNKYLREWMEHGI